MLLYLQSNQHLVIPNPGRVAVDIIESASDASMQNVISEIIDGQPQA